LLIFKQVNNKTFSGKVECYKSNTATKTKTKSVEWLNGNWAHDCDFPGNDLKSVASSGESCGQTCYETEGCSHFAWSKHKGGICWLKKGNVGKANAVWNKGAVCGVL